VTSRRSFVAGAAAAATGAGLSTLAAPAIAQARTEWRMVTGWPKGLPGVGEGAQRIADRITALTEGRLTVRLYPAGELVPVQEGMDAVVDGRVEMAHDMASYYIAKSPAFAFFAAVPFGLLAQELNAWVVSGGGQALWDDLGKAYGVKSFLAGNTGAQLGGWFREEIKDVAGLKGLRARVPGLAGQALARLGVQQVLMPGGDILDALQAGTLDAAEFMGPVNDAPFGFDQGARILYWPGFQDPSAAFQLQVNAERFGALPASQQAAIEAACGEENLRSLSDYSARTPAVIDELVARGVELKQFPPDVFAAFGKAVGEVLQEVVEAGDEHTRRIAASYFAFRSKTMLWTRIGEQGFANMRLLDYPFPQG
jgi:TRAP-type mannitol/chloroaromatic compound transport system substrate-binding protein